MRGFRLLLVRCVRPRPCDAAEGTHYDWDAVGGLPIGNRYRTACLGQRGSFPRLVATYIVVCIGACCVAMDRSALAHQCYSARIPLVFSFCRWRLGLDKAQDAWLDQASGSQVSAKSVKSDLKTPFFSRLRRKYEIGALPLGLWVCLASKKRTIYELRLDPTFRLYLDSRRARSCGRVAPADKLTPRLAFVFPQKATNAARTAKARATPRPFMPCIPLPQLAAETGASRCPLKIPCKKIAPLTNAGCCEPRFCAPSQLLTNPHARMVVAARGDALVWPR